MKHISLIPEEYKVYLKSEKKINTIAVAAAIVILIFVLLYATLSFSLLIPQAELDAIRDNRELIRVRSGELLSYEQMKESISGIEALYEQVMQDNPDWGSLLVQIFNTIPENIWLDQFSIDYEENKGMLTMRGWADSHDKVADWLAVLKQNENLSNVLCQSSAMSSTEASSTIQLEISAELYGVTASKATEEGSERK